MKKEHNALSVLLCTAVLFACLNVTTADATIMQPITKSTLDKTIRMPTATPVPFPENVTATPNSGKPGKITPVPYRPTIGPLLDKPTAQPPTKVPTAMPGGRTPGPVSNVQAATATPTVTPTVTPSITPLIAEPQIDTIYAEALSSTSIHLTWEGSDDSAVGYLIYRDTHWIPRFFRTEQSLTDTGLVPDTIYSFAVAYAYPTGGEGMSGGPIGTWVSCSTLLPAPQGLSAILTAIEFELSWEEVNNAEGYIVYRRDEPQGSFHEILRVESARAITITPPAGTTYGYRVSAVNQWGEGDVSSELLVTGRSNLSLRAPTGFTATPTDYTNVFTLTWDPVPGADRYYIYKNREHMDYAIIGPVTVPPYSTGVLLFDTTYEYTVRAANEAVYGRDSETLTLHIPPAVSSYLRAPTITAGFSMGSSRIKLSWSSVSGAAKYQVYQSGGLVTTVTGCTCTIEGLIPMGQYTYKVRALDGFNAAGPFSEPKMIKTGEGFPAPEWNYIHYNEPVELCWLSCYIRLSRYESEYPQEYVIYRREEGSSAYERICTVNGQTYEYSQYAQDDDIIQPGKRYYYMVRAYSDQRGEGYPSEELSIKTPMLAPYGLRATVLTPNSIRLDWNAVEDAVSYKIRLPDYWNSDQLYYEEMEVTEPFYVYNLSDDCGNNPKFGVSYVDVDNETSPYAWITVRIKLEAPQGLTVMALDSGRVHLSWQPVDGAESYNVYRARLPKQGFDLVGHSTTDAGLNANTYYYYKVAAVNGAGPGDLSNMVVVRTGIAVPQDLVATSISSSRIGLAWSAVPGADAYNVYRSDTSDEIRGFICQVTGNSMTDQGLIPNTYHSYQVAAVIGSRAGEASAPASARTRVAAPEGLTATALDSSRVMLSWNRVDGAEGYYVYRSSLQKGGFALVGQGTTDTGLSANTVYYYKVAAVNGAGPGDLSSAVEVRTGIAVPQNLVATSISSSRILLTWSAVPGADAYNVYRGDASDILGFICQETGNSMMDQGLYPNTYHSYKVTAVSGGREGEASDQASARTIVAAPEGLTAVAQGGGSIRLTWQAVNGAQSYTIYSSLAPQGGYEPVDITASTVFTDTGLSPGMTYYYIVSASNQWGEGIMSNWVSAYTVP